jgi:long-chain acyl-CoA synthetase
MNAFDFFFENTSQLDKPFLLGKETTSYRQLYTSCLSLADKLKERFGENNNMLLASDNSLFNITVYLSIIKSGNIFIPLDPVIEEENFRNISELTNPVLIFLTRDIAAKLHIDPFLCMFPEAISSESKNSSHLAEKDNFNHENCAEIIFTSGSTGKPKGVMISHKNLIANTRSIISYLELNSNDKMLVVLPFFYCYGLSLLHTHLRVGGSIVLNNSFIFLVGILKNLQEYKCTGFAGVPSHYQILLRKSETFKKTQFPYLRYVTQAGGNLPTVFIDEFRESFPNVSFYVMYGQTEATARLSYLNPDLYEKKKGSIGKGIPGVELRVVNENGESVKPCETGEIIAKGDNIMMGYYKDPEATNSTIRGGWLFTGDIGFVDEEGFIYLTARKKEIIKVRGKRISPREIQKVILELPEVIDCHIEGIADELSGEALKAVIVINEKGDMNSFLEKIKKHCHEHLALYKIPKIFELSTHLTINSSGKKKETLKNKFRLT